MTRREAFVNLFGEDEAKALEGAAEHHKNGVHDRTGTDPFRWAICICIGYECFTKESYADYHGIKHGKAIKNWLLQSEQREWMAAHDGDVDFLACFSGAYDPYMPVKGEEKP